MVYILALLGMLCWGISPIFAKIGLENVSPLIGLSVAHVFHGCRDSSLAAAYGRNRRAEIYLVAHVVVVDRGGDSGHPDWGSRLFCCLKRGLRVDCHVYYGLFAACDAVLFDFVFE